MSWWLIFALNDDDLEARAAVEDEGALIVTLITLAAIAYASYAIFAALHQKSQMSDLALAVALAGAPLGWFMLHTVTALRYAHLYYNGRGGTDWLAPIKFPDCEEPGPWEFVYFAFVVGMTAQVSDTLIQTTRMRRSVMAHSTVSFFFNTVLIAMAVNAAVTIAA
jgi:uncharacterized membrane protein